jgi:hypothetical protein
MDSSVEDARTMRFPLRFAPGIEEAFQEYYWREGLPHVRLAFALALMLVVSFGGVDALLLSSGEERRAVWLIRYVYCAPILALGVFSKSETRLSSPRSQNIGCGMSCGGGGNLSDDSGGQ